MIDGERLRQARELHQMTQTQLVEHVPELTQSRLSRIERGDAAVDGSDLVAATIAAATGVTVEWLSRPAAASISALSPHFRARSRTTQSTKTSGMAWANLVNEAHVSLSSYVTPIRVTLPRLSSVSPRQAAWHIRRQLGFDAFQSLPYLVLAIERLGVRILGLPWRPPTVMPSALGRGRIPPLCSPQMFPATDFDGL